MAEITLKENIFFQWIFWQFFDVPKSILTAWRNFLKFGLNYFSIPLLLKTLFSHWRRYRWLYPKGLDFGKYLEAFFSNLISRILGLIMRSILIIIGISAEIFIVFIGAAIFIGWLTLPALFLAGLWFGFRIIL